MLLRSFEAVFGRTAEIFRSDIPPSIRELLKASKKELPQ